MVDPSAFGRTFAMITPHPGQIRASGPVARPHFGHEVMIGKV